LKVGSVADGDGMVRHRNTQNYPRREIKYVKTPGLTVECALGTGIDIPRGQYY